MSYSTIYFIGLTVVFAIYYLALMYLDLKAKKEEKSLPRLKRPMTAMLSETVRMAQTVQTLLLAVGIREMPLMATRLKMS